MTEAHDFELEIDNLPNRLTIFRVLLIPIVVGSLFLIKYPYSYTVGMEDTLGWFAGWIFTLASITDFLDGYIARKKNIVTVFGSFLDPIADKFLVVSSLIMLLYLDRIHSILVIILILREMYITSLRLLAYSEDVQVSSQPAGQVEDRHTNGGNSLFNG
jgi:CDP-diacylglycerol--glycerol-3-phosphate 3-phosphatidyltransferase